MSNISVLQRTQRIVVDPASRAVVVINEGPQGPGGPAGPPGGDVTIANDPTTIAATSSVTAVSPSGLASILTWKDARRNGVSPSASAAVNRAGINLSITQAAADPENKIVLLPGGIIDIDSAIIAAVDVEVRGSIFSLPTTLRMQGSGRMVNITNTPGFKLIDVVLDCNKSNVADDGTTIQHGVFVSSSNATGCPRTVLRKVKVMNAWDRGIAAVATAVDTNPLDIDIIDCEVFGSGGTNIFVQNAQRSLIDGNDVYAGSLWGVHVAGGRKAMISNNRSHDHVLGGANRGHGIVVNTDCEDFSIVDNDVYGNTASNTWGIVVGTRATKFIVSRNRAGGNWGGITIDVADTVTNPIDTIGVVSDNVITDSTTSNGLHVNQADGLVISGNMSAYNAQSGIEVYGRRCVVFGNVAHHNGRHGISFREDLTAPLVSAGPHEAVGNLAYLNNQSAGVWEDYHSDELTNGPVTWGGSPDYDARHYGLKLDGISDDTAKLQALVDRIQVSGVVRGGTIRFPINSKVRLTATIEINQAAIIFQGSGRGFGGTEFVWYGAAADDMFRILDSSNVEFRDCCILGNETTPPRAGVYAETPVAATVGTNERISFRNVSFGRHYTQEAGAPDNTPMQYGFLQGGAVDGNNDAFLFQDTDFHDCSVAGVWFDNFQGIWDLFTNCLFDQCAIGIYSECSFTFTNLTFNRCPIDIKLHREIQVTGHGYWSENSGKLFELTSSAGLQIYGGKVVLTTLFTGTDWATVTTHSLRSLFKLRDLRIYDGGAPNYATAKISIVGSSSAVAPGEVSIRDCNLPNGDSSAGYDLDAFAASGMIVDIKQGDYEHIGFITTLNAVGRLGGNVMRRSTYSGVLPAGAIEATCDRRGVNGTFTAASGVLHLVGIVLPRGASVGSISFHSSTVAMVSPTNWWFGLFDLNRVALRLTADQLTAPWAASVEKKLNLTSPFVTQYDGLYYLGRMIAATTLPNFLAQAASTTAVGLILPNLSATTGDTGMTTPPTLPFTAAAFVATQPGLPLAWVSP